MLGFFVRIVAFCLGVFGVLYYYTGGDFSSLAQRATPLTMIVRDDSHFLSEADQEEVRRYYATFLKEFDVDFRVMVVGGAVDVDAAVDPVMLHWQVGSKSLTQQGVLLFVAPDSNRVRFRVTSGAGGMFPDSFISYLQNRQMSRELRQRQVAKAVLGASALIFQRMADAKGGKIFDSRRQELLARGVDPDAVRLSQNQERVVTPEGVPVEVLQAYIHAMRTRDPSPNLRIYSQTTRDLLVGQPPSFEEMASVVNLARSCPLPEVRLTQDQKHAVLRYPVYERSCPPWFLVVENGTWRLDLTVPRQLVRTDRLGEWYFITGVRHAYEDAFSDWVFNGDGYPQEP